MYEQELRESLSVEELAERAITVPIQITDLDTFEKLIELSKEESDGGRFLDIKV